jgi:hypothetical protein
MGNRTLSVPTVIINNETYSIVPNSFMYDGGEGEITVRSASAGGGNSKSVHSQNAETQIGKCKFDVFLVPGLDSDIATWKENVGSNSIQAIQRDGKGESVTLSWDNMSLINAVERQASADGVTSLEFEGDRMSSQ